ncbi:MAG TPA: ABC transporter substrate-binding protein, partial [Candidatus Brocadiaceae bacterium]|nr:ABC transporter substrate-binding protein [Candidatus Brocadiaceae bacterium]
LDAPCLREVAGDAAVEGTIFCTIAFQGTDGLTAPQTSFAERFNRKYCILPNAWTAQAYDTMMVLAYAMEVAGSTLPNKVAETLHFIQDWQGITGVYTFDEKGDILDKNSDILVVRNGEGVFDAELTRLIQETE